MPDEPKINCLTCGQATVLVRSVYMWGRPPEVEADIAIHYRASLRALICESCYQALLESDRHRAMIGGKDWQLMPQSRKEAPIFDPPIWSDIIRRQTQGNETDETHTVSDDDLHFTLKPDQPVGIKCCVCGRRPCSIDRVTHHHVGERRGLVCKCRDCGAIFHMT